MDGIDFLGQGTIYPDIVESGTKTAKMVKSHHNVGGLPEDLQFQLVEPLRQLFKDEVRACGLELGLPYEMVYRQPFPGPGLGVRCLGAITRDRLEAVRESDAILREEFQIAGLDKKVWQYFTVVPDFKSVGVRDNARSFDWPVIIRAVSYTHLVETAGDIDTLLLDKTGTITIGNRKATHFHTAPGIDLHAFVENCLLSSLSDETPEGKSIVELGRESGIRMRSLNTVSYTHLGADRDIYV